MTERPILFSAPMVRALLDGSKTQTRRVIKDLPPWKITEIVPSASGCGRWLPNGPAPSGRGMASGHWRPCPYGQPGDRLWVRETWADLAVLSDGNYERQAIYRADDIELYGDEDEPVNVNAPDMRWRPSIHMPRWASRILLEVVAVRVERLKECSEADALAEGAPGYEEGVDAPPPSDEHEWSYGASYQRVWEDINGAGSWDANPWVWVVEFKRVAP